MLQASGDLTKYEDIKQICRDIYPNHPNVTYNNPCPTTMWLPGKAPRVTQFTLHSTTHPLLLWINSGSRPGKILPLPLPLRCRKVGATPPLLRRGRSRRRGAE